MKTFTGKLANGDEYDACEAPKEAKTWYHWVNLNRVSLYDESGKEVDVIELGFNHKPLGFYSTAGEIDFAEKHELSNYSLLTAFDRDSKKAYPIEVNHVKIECDSIYDRDSETWIKLQQQWRESESQVRPKHWLIILKG